MRYKKAKKILARVSYKPNVRFVLEKEENCPCLRMYIDNTPDAMQEGLLDVVARLPLPGNKHRLFLSKPMFFSKLQVLIGETETHERQEWLKIDGKCFFNPHTRETAELR